MSNRQSHNSLAPVLDPAPGEAAPDELDDEHNWSDCPDIVIREQPVTKVYSNPYGQVVIRQLASLYGNHDDPFVFFSRENIPALIAALQKAVSEHADLVTSPTDVAPAKGHQGAAAAGSQEAPELPLARTVA